MRPLPAGASRRASGACRPARRGHRPRPSAAHHAASSSGRSLSVHTAKARAGGPSSMRGVEECAELVALDVGERHPLRMVFGQHPGAQLRAAARCRGRRRPDARGSSRSWAASAGGRTEVLAARARRAPPPRTLSTAAGSTASTSRGRATDHAGATRGRWAARTPTAPPPSARCRVSKRLGPQDRRAARQGAEERPAAGSRSARSAPTRAPTTALAGGGTPRTARMPRPGRRTRRRSSRRIAASSSP